MLAGKLRGRLILATQQGAKPGVDALDVLAGQRRLQEFVDMLEQVVDVAAACSWMRLVQRPRSVGGTDDPVPAPRDDEQDALLRTHDEAGRGVDPVARHND